jgi:hypothetical protein
MIMPPRQAGDAWDIAEWLLQLWEWDYSQLHSSPSRA